MTVKGLKTKGGFILIKPDAELPVYKTADLVGIYSHTSWNVFTRTYAILLMNAQYFPIGKVLPKLKSDMISELINISLVDNQQFSCLVFMFAFAEGQTDLTEVSSTRHYYDTLRSILFIYQYMALNGYEHKTDSYSLFDQEKELYKGVTLSTFIRVFTSTDLDSFGTFVKALKDGDGKETATQGNSE